MNEKGDVRPFAQPVLLEPASYTELDLGGNCEAQVAPMLVLLALFATV